MIDLSHPSAFSYQIEYMYRNKIDIDYYQKLRLWNIWERQNRKGTDPKTHTFNLWYKIQDIIFI